MIPVFEPDIGEHEINAVVEALKRGEISGTFGEALASFEREFAAYVGCKHAIACSSGTTALHLAVRAARIGVGNEILTSASTNIASALAAYHNGAVPVPVDSESQTWNLNLDLLEELITPRTRAVMPVHLFGHPVDMDRLCAIAVRHDLLVIEDCAESHGATCRGRMTGSFGDMGCFSFYANKIITTGEGGMVTTDDEQLAGRLRLLRNLAFTKPRFWHEEAGYNFRMTGFQAAMGLAQLRRIDDIIANKRRMARIYNERLADIPGLRLPPEEPWAKNVFWMYALTVDPPFAISRDELASGLSAVGIETRTFFCPMNQQPFLQRQPGYRKIACPVADRLWQTGLYLPSAHTLSEEQITFIGESVRRAAGLVGR
ncbi:MAG: DegT/DnrJ/EryC1/StrS family aminotransferase [Chloroflexi bacterium]|nr:MAG: DegT/DnrJ/EryC1/StrS family aminotransferase [Chloroflexota bacterium]